MQPTRAQPHQLHRQRAVVRGRRHLPDPIVPSHHVRERFVLPIARVLRGDPLLHVRLVGEEVQRQAIRAQSEEAFLERFIQQPPHAVDLLAAGVASDARLETHHLDAQHRVRHERREVRRKRQLLQVLVVARRRAPGCFVRGHAQHRFRHVLHAREAVNDRVLAIPSLRAVGQTDAAVAHHGRRCAMPNHLRQPRVQLRLEVLMRVDIDHARNQVCAADVVHLLGSLLGQVVAHRRNAAATNRQIHNVTRLTATIKYLCTAQDRVPVHAAVPQRAYARRLSRLESRFNLLFAVPWGYPARGRDAARCACRGRQAR